MINTFSDEWQTIVSYIDKRVSRARKLLEDCEEFNEILKLQERIRTLEDLKALPSHDRPDEVSPLGFEIT